MASSNIPIILIKSCHKKEEMASDKNACIQLYKNQRLLIDEENTI